MFHGTFMATVTKTARKRRAASAARARTGDPGPGWKIRRAAGIAVLTCDALSRIPWLVHGFSTRTGGESVLDKANRKQDKERVLNLGFTEWDSREIVARNRRKLQKALEAEKMPLVPLHQIHSDVAYVIARSSKRASKKASKMAPGGAVKETPLEPQQGDAMITREPGLLLGIQTADCVPILLVDTKTRVVAAIHAGWRGTLARIAAKTLGRMRFEFGTQPGEVVAALGPAIGRCCYEVGPEVAQAFSGQFAPAGEWFDGPFARLALGEEPNPLPWLTMIPPGHEAPPERVQLDLRAANRWQLLDAGVAANNIAVSGLCTACRTDLLFSYRREGPRSGRLMAVVGIAAATTR